MLLASSRTSVLPIAGALLGLSLVVFAAIPVLFAGALSSGDSSLEGLVAGAVCATSGPITGLTDAAAQNGRTIAAVASARGGPDSDSDRAALITVMVGLAESGLRVLGNPNDPTAIGLPTEGIGHDHDSLGIFQQRPSWGTAQQRLDPVTSANLFLDRLLAKPLWNKAKVWVVAQQVQASAYDGRPRPVNHFSDEYGGNYRAALKEATRVLNVIKHDSAKLSCEGTGGSGVGELPSGPLDAHGLPVNYVIPHNTTPQARTAVLAGITALGRPYVFGATGPNAFDCSGLTQWAWAQAGVDLPHYTVDQWHQGIVTDEHHLRAGDLVLTPGSDGTLSNPQHVGMFIGVGLVLEAPQTGDVVKVVTYQSFVSAGTSGLRHIA